MGNKILALIRILKEQTVENKVTWGKTQRTDEYITKTKTGSITIDSYMAQDEADGDDIHIVDICILNGSSVISVGFDHL
jgi:hypothetical protein